jgi:transcription elongation factor GreA
VKSGAQVAYTLVAPNEASLALKKISIESPIGKGLLGTALGDVVDIQTPNGPISFEVVDISRS